MPKLKKTCIHTNVLSYIDNQIKFIKRTYILHDSKIEAEAKSSKINMTGWTKLGTTSDKHKVFKNQLLVEEVEIWANDKYLIKNSLLDSDNISEETNNEIFVGKSYKLINNFTDNFIGFDAEEDLNESETALSYFGFLRQYYYDMTANPENYGLKIVCPDFKSDIKKDENNKLIYARALDTKGRVIFAVEKI